jgi:tetratricopeptide (TPR) repeat protein
MAVLPNLSRNLVCGKPRTFGMVATLTVLLVTSSAFARAKHRATTASLVPLESALQSNDINTAQTLASSIYQQIISSFTATNQGIIIDAAVVTTQTVAFVQCRTAYEIADSFYRFADLTDAQQWATTATALDSLGDPYARRATVLLGNIAYAMDRDGVAATNFMTVIVLPNLYPEQASAYAGLLNVLLMEQQSDQVTQWVQTGQIQFAGADKLQLDFLQDAEMILKQRNHPLWHDLDQQIVDLFPTNMTFRLRALQELASNARKFQRWAEAETNYAAICAMPLSSERLTVDTWFLLAECQSQQGEDVTATLSNLTAACAGFADTEDCDYGTYRLGKFYEQEGSNDLAYATYEILSSGGSTSTWAAAALHELASLTEKQGDLQAALQLYLQYPQQFPQDQHFVIESYSSAMGVAVILGDTNSANSVYNAITNNAADIQDYNVMLNLALYFKTKGNRQLAQNFLTNGVQLAQQALGSTSDFAQRYLIHYRVLRRLTDFANPTAVLNYWQQNAADFAQVSEADPSSIARCTIYEALALFNSGQQQEGIDMAQNVLSTASGNSTAAQTVAFELYRLLEASQNDPSAISLAQWVDAKYPSGPWSAAVRLALAQNAFQTGDVAGAQVLTEQVINSLPEHSKMEWINSVAQRARGLRARCMQTTGS